MNTPSRRSNYVLIFLAFWLGCILVLSAQSTNESPRYHPSQILVTSGVRGLEEFHAQIGARVIHRYHIIAWELVELPAGLSVEEAVFLYNNSGLLVRAEPNYYVYIGLDPSWPTGNPETNASVYFLVKEPENRRSANDSFVIGLSRPEDIAHARWLIAIKAISSMPTEFPRGAMVRARVIASGDGINRNYDAPNMPAWRWHVTEVGFADDTIPESSVAPAEIDNLARQFPSTNFYGAFMGYTVARELGPRPLYSKLELRNNQLRFNWSGARLNEYYIVESADSVTSTNWLIEAAALAPAQTNQFSLPLPSGPARFYRIRSQPLEPGMLPQ